MTQLELTLNYPGMRLDRALALAHPDLSRVQWQKLVREKQVTIEGKPTKGSQKLSGAEIVVAILPEVTEIEIEPEDIPLDILFEDDDLMVINKAAGMVVHPSLGSESGTLVNAILHHCPDLKGIGHEKRPGIVHRLDKNTSGVIVVAKNDHALRDLQNQFRERTVFKQYLALVEGRIQPPKALIDAPIGRDPKNRKRMAIIPLTSSAVSRASQTTYELVSLHKHYSLLRCTLHTGRTHQIRVHLSYITFPLVGDTIYGRKRPELLKDRHFLHAAELGFTHPRTGEEIKIKTELPPDLQAVLDELGD